MQLLKEGFRKKGLSSYISKSTGEYRLGYEGDHAPHPARSKFAHPPALDGLARSD
jgi:hypothetical protein